MRIPWFGRRSVRPRQRVLAFVERASRRERLFKRAILLLTGVVIILIFRAFPWGRYLSSSIDAWASRSFRAALGRSRSRREIDESWRDFRRREIELLRPRVERYFAESDPNLQRLMRYAGMDPEHGLLRWGNFNWTLLLSSKVFEPDDDGRSYRLRPGVRSIWLRDLAMSAGAAAFYLVPDGPGLAEAIRGTSASPVAASRQTANSWGLRGAEPDLDAPLRGIVLGDSFMQGMFIGDDETPPECLRRHLQRQLKTRVSILNTGVMGYSPEQYYYSLLAFADRFRPHFVVVSVFANDFGNAADVAGRGVGDWQEGKYWLQKTLEYCRAHGWPCLIVPAPVEDSLLKKRNSGYYPGTLANMLDLESTLFLNPMEDFANAHLRAHRPGERNDRPPRQGALFNDDIHDSHFSAAGAELWAEAVGHRLVPLLGEHWPDRGEDASGRRVAGSPGKAADRAPAEVRPH
jgi:lysophospholipase L1-like esterase